MNIIKNFDGPEEVRLLIDENAVSEYTAFYFALHPKASVPPIRHPYHPSINEWMVMKRPMMNAVKQKWKDFIVWLVNRQGYANLHIAQCDIEVLTMYKTDRPHDVDNSVIKFILDGFCDSGLIVDDNSSCVQSLTLRCGVDRERPRTEIFIKIGEI